MQTMLQHRINNKIINSLIVFPIKKGNFGISDDLSVDLIIFRESYAIESVAEPFPALASTTSVPPSWISFVSAKISSSNKLAFGVAWSNAHNSVNKLELEVTNHVFQNRIYCMKERYIVLGKTVGELLYLHDHQPQVHWPLDNRAEESISKCRLSESAVQMIDRY